jgi:hypothetical protein
MKLKKQTAEEYQKRWNQIFPDDPPISLEEARQAIEDETEDPIEAAKEFQKEWNLMFPDDPVRIEEVLSRWEEMGDKWKDDPILDISVDIRDAVMLAKLNDMSLEELQAYVEKKWNEKK